MTKAAKNAAQQFSDLGWGHWQWLLGEIKKSAVPIRVFYRGQPLTLTKPRKVSKTERETMLGLMALREPLEGDIYRQATCTNAAVAAVLASIGVSTDEPHVNLKLKQIREDIIQETVDPVDQFKRKFLRPRPWIEIGAELAPLMMPPHKFYPGQPAYPAGHATVAWMVAYLFGKHGTPSQKAKLEAAAAQVALNRVIAGVHYPSDSEAGRKLAEQIVSIMRKKRLPLVTQVKAFMQALPNSTPAQRVKALRTK
jgi:acid phosphatase (class A)